MATLFLEELEKTVKTYVRGGNNWTRYPMLYILLHPFVHTWFALKLSLFQAVLWAFFPIIPLGVLALASPVLTGAAVEIQATRRIIGWLAFVVIVEIVFGLYVVLVPLKNDPAIGYLPLLLLIVTLPLVFKHHEGFLRVTSIGAVVGLVVLAVVFFMGGRECIKTDTKKGADTARCLFGSKPDSTKASQSRNLVLTVEPRVMELELQAGDTARGPGMWPGSHHEIWANHQFLVVAARVEKGDTVFQTYVMPAGSSSWNGGAPKGTLRLKGLRDSTVIRFTRS